MCDARDRDANVEEPSVQVSLDDLISGAIAGQIVSFPTDTVPALAVRPDCAERVFQAKGRSLNKPLILMGATPEQLWPYTSGSDRERSQWQAIAERYWPGQLTLVLPASPAVPAAVNPGDPSTIGLRIPDLDLARTLLSRTGPLATTSANRSGEPPLSDLAAIAAAFPQGLVLDASSPPASGVPSTVAKWLGEGWQILRQGRVQLEGRSR